MFCSVDWYAAKWIRLLLVPNNELLIYDRNSLVLTPCITNRTFTLTMKVAPPRLDAHKRQPALVIRIRPYNLYGSLGEASKLSWAFHGGRRAVTLLVLHTSDSHRIAQKESYFMLI